MEKTNNQIVAELAAVAGKLAEVDTLPPNQQADALFTIHDADLAELIKAAGDRLAIVSATAMASDGSAAACDVLFERMRQQEQERFDQAHDDAHSTGGLARAAACYLAPAAWSLTFVAGDPPTPPDGWPWEDRWWKPGGDDPESYRRRLVKAAALTIAEIERVDRLAASKAIG